MFLSNILSVISLLVLIDRCPSAKLAVILVGWRLLPMSLNSAGGDINSSGGSIMTSSFVPDAPWSLLFSA